ncbi:MAG: insulinase family protein [Muribaculaceae bacterium]|nr:insulinase family protein [Muribaculaceae bacterium]
MNTPDRSKAPKTDRPRNMSLPPVQYDTLPNGIKMVTYNRSDQDVNRIAVMVPGAEAESAGAPELPLIMANMLCEGTADMSGSEISELLDFNGSWYKGMANAHYTTISTYSLNSRLSHVLPAIIGMLTQPSFPEKALRTVCENQAAKIETARKEVDFHSNYSSMRLSMGNGHPLATVPDPERIRALTPDMLREFHARHYRPDAMTVFVAGNITPQIDRMIKQRFSKIASRRSTPTPQPNIQPFAPQTDVDRYYVDRHGALQSSVRITLPAIARSHPDYTALWLTVYALGGYFGSRLMSNIREDKGFTYGINASLLGYLEGSFVQIATNCDNRYVNPAINEIFDEMHKMATNPCGASELERLKQQATAGLLETFDSPFSIMDCYQGLQTMGVGTEYMARRCRTIDTITPKKIVEMSQKYLNPANAMTVVAGDITKM